MPSAHVNITFISFTDFVANIQWVQRHVIGILTNCGALSEFDAKDPQKGAHDLHANAHIPLHFTQCQIRRQKLHQPYVPCMV